MPLEIPARLKVPGVDVGRFAHRAAQLEKHKPIVAYWCYYWVLNQILTQHLQNQDAECTAYATQLMDVLEELKSNHASDDAVVDDAAAQIYVEQFGLETFQRADNAIIANKATRQTADTFLAASTFLDLLRIWGSPSSDIAKQIKYAKYNAARILKAIKAGEDPNLSNPTSKPSEEIAELESQQPDVHTDNGPAAQKPSVDDISDEYDQVKRGLAVTPSLDKPFPPSRSSSVPRPTLANSNDLPNSNATVSPISATDRTTHDERASQDDATKSGGYFPDISPSSPEDPSSTVSNNTLKNSNLHQSPGLSSPQASETVQQSYHAQSSSASLPSQQATSHVPRVQHHAAGQTSVSHSAQDYVADDLAVNAAQKHAKFAISALNFEDVNTAVKELRLALQSLGAQ